MENKERFTPISDVWFRSDRLRFQIPFPTWVEDQNIGVDVQRAERLMRLGGIEHTRVVAQKHGEASVSMPTIIGVAPDGSAYAGRVAAAKRNPTYEYEHQPVNAYEFFQNLIWTSLKIELNLDEVEGRILESGKSVREADSWTPHLDKALRGGIRRAGTDHLLRGHNSLRLGTALFINIHQSLMDAAGVSLYDAMLGKFNPHIPKVGELALEAGFEFVWWTLYATWVYRKRHQGAYRVSIFPGYEIDRAIGLQLLARTLPLVKTIENDEGK